MKLFKSVVTIILFSGCGAATTTESHEALKLNTTIAPSHPSKQSIALFNDIEATRAILSKNGIGDLHQWRSDEMGGYMSITDYHQFGAGQNIAYYLESDNVNYIQTLKLVLNINEKKNKQTAIDRFATVVEQTFKSLNITMPEGLLKAIKDGEEYEQDGKEYITTLKLDKSKIDT